MSRFSPIQIPRTKDTIQTCALMVVLFSASILVDVPEVGLLMLICAKAAPTERIVNVGDCVQRINKHKFMRGVRDSCRSSSMALFVAMLLMVMICGWTESAIVICTVTAFLGVQALGKSRSRKFVENVKCMKVTPCANSKSSVRSCSANCNRPAKVCSIGQERKACWWLNGSTSIPSCLPPQELQSEIKRVIASSTPAAADERLMLQLKTMAQKRFEDILSGAEVSCSSQHNFEIIAGMGDKPQLDLVVTVDHEALYKSMASMKKDTSTWTYEHLRKTATKVLAERLSFVKFWRSQYSGPEPVLVFLLPPEKGFCKYPLIINFGVNVVHPVRLDRVVTNATVRTKELILLVVRWARQRCVCNISRGQPTPYMWSLLALHFSYQEVSTAIESSISDLFAEFFRFYFQRLQSAEPLFVNFSSHVAVPNADNASWSIPSIVFIEDLFETGINLASHLSADGMVRVQEEMLRAVGIFGQGENGKLARLLERWFPASSEKHSS